MVDGRHAGYGDDAFLDMVHLNWRGAATLSAELAAVLRRYPDGPTAAILRGRGGGARPSLALTPRQSRS